MITAQQELIWEGRIHIGDEPGVYGDAEYPGIAAEWPVTLFRSDDATTDKVTFIIDAEKVTVFAPYPGHLVTITLYEDDGTGTFTAKETTLATDRLKSNATKIDVQVPKTKRSFISVRVRVDTTVLPGLYNDFELIRLSIKATNFEYTAGFGFQTP
jgi:hypothetical protein